jgi:glycosyltransferase involved in cell wall biosynthesis
MLRVQMVPGLDHFRSHESGIKRVVEAYCQYLPEFGIQVVGTEEGTRYNVKAVHAGTAPDCDVAHLHGLYWTADYEAAAWEWRANAVLVDNLRRARQVTVPSEWVAQTLRRDLRLAPHVIPHGIEWDGWAHHHQEPGGYVLWNKNRAADVCDPAPMAELARRVPKVKFLSTFAPEDAPSNVENIGLQPHEGMKMLVQGADVYLSTTKETFGIGILEAMAAGVPVLSFDWGGASQLVQHQVNGWLAHPGDFDDLCEGLVYCAEHRAALGDAGREMAKHYKWRDVCERVARVYKLAAQEELATAAIVIPTHNYADRVGRAVESALLQTYPYLTDVVVVDDGSDDNGATEDAVSKYKDKRLRYIRQGNAGVAVARNAGIEAVDAKYVCCLDADDAIQPEFLDKCVTALEADRTLGLAFAGLWQIYPDGKQGRSPWPDGYDFELQLKRRNQVPTCCVFRREAWARLGGYRRRYCPDGAGSEDAEFWLRMGAYGWGAAQATKEPLFVYSLGAGHVTGKKGYSEPDWLTWHPWVQDRQFPLACIAEPKRMSHPVRSYDKPWVSIIVPVGPGHQEIVVDALDSLEAQTFRKWECVLVNDTGDPLPERLLRAYPYVTLVETEGRKGAGYARNRGVEASKAPFLTFLDADDYLQPEFLRACLEAKMEHGHWVYTDIWSSWADGTIHEYAVDDFDVESLWRDGLNAVTSLLDRRQFKDAGGFDEGMETREDWDFYLKLVMAGHCGMRLPRPLVTYRLATGERRNKQAKRTADALRKQYPMEELMAGCGNCAKRAKQASMAARELPDNWSTKEEAGFEQVEYTGGNRATTTFTGITGRPYRFGNNDESRVGWMHPQDVVNFIDVKGLPFKRVAHLTQTQSIPGALVAPTV